MLVDMKGLALAFGSILGILIITSVVILYITATGEVKRGIVTAEGKIISFVNEAEIFTKTFDQSIEFISQRAAYDLGKTGGFYDGNGLWDYFYPRLDILEKNLEKSIKNNLPSQDIVGRRIVKWYETDVDTSSIGFLESSKGFSVEGNKTFYIYDESIETRVSHSPFEMESSITSSYYRLLYVGRQILENEKYNSTLHDIGNLTNLLENDFGDLDFEITASEDIVDINIEDNTCMLFYNEYYCLAPLNPEEDGATINGEQIPYDYLKLNFNINATQTALTPLTPDFSLEVVPPSGSVDAGDSLGDIRVLVRSSGGETKPVHLDFDVVSANTGLPEQTIDVSFDRNDEIPNYVSIMTIDTETWTLSDNYEIIIIGTVNEGTADEIEKRVTFILTVNPIMEFSLETIPDRAEISQGDTVTTTININFIDGTYVPVFLSSSSLPDTTITFVDPITGLPSDSCTPTCSLNMKIETLHTVPTGEYDIIVTGIGGGVMNYTKFTISIYPPFDYDIYLTPDSRDLHPGEGIDVGIRVEKTKGISEAVKVVTEGSGTTEPTITINLIPSDTCTPDPIIGLPSDCDIVMRITTQDGTAAHTPFGSYIIDVVPNGDLIKSKTFILKVVPPTFDFVMELDSYSGTIDPGPGNSKDVTITITKTTPLAAAEEVSLSSSVSDGADASKISVDFNPVRCTPSPNTQKCTSTMTITAQGGDNPTAAGNYYIDVYGEDGGKTHAKTYTLTVSEIFDFSIILDSYDGVLYPEESVYVTVTVNWGKGTPQLVELSSSITKGDGTQLSVQIDPFVCTPDPTCESTMTITTYTTTELGEYWIKVIGDSPLAGVTREAGRYELIVSTGPFCGDGNVDVGEECDDGNENENDACTNFCKWNICGDWIIYTGVEECDGPNLDGKTCKHLGFDCGTLSCTAGCKFDTTDCISTTFSPGGEDGWTEDESYLDRWIGIHAEPQRSATKKVGNYSIWSGYYADELIFDYNYKYGALNPQEWDTIRYWFRSDDYTGHPDFYFCYGDEGCYAFPGYAQISCIVEEYTTKGVWKEYEINLKTDCTWDDPSIDEILWIGFEFYPNFDMRAYIDGLYLCKDCCLKADVNGDCFVDLRDLTLCMSGDMWCDLDNNGVVDEDEEDFVIAHFGETC